MDMRILESRDPDGRLAERIQKGGKVKESDYDALVTLSSKYLGKASSGDDHVDIQYTKAPRKEKTYSNSFNPRVSKPPSNARQNLQNTIVKTQKLADELESKTAKRRERRQKRSKKTN